MNILVLDDEAEIADLVELFLKNEGYNVYKFYSSSEAIKCINSTPLDLALLDVMLPDTDGFTILRKIREEGFRFPVIMLTAKVEDNDKIIGLSLGADDYITKPYQAPILLARIAAVLKRTRGNTEKTSYSYENVRLDLLKCTISCDEKEVELTKNEMKILHLLFMHAGNYVARQDLIESLWDNQIFIDDNTLSVHVTRIREKLRELGRDNFIQTKRGMGYRI